MKIFIQFISILILSSTLTLAKLPKGSTPPDFSLREVNTGKEYKLSSFKNKIVVLEWHSPTCSFSTRHAKEKTMIRLHRKFKDVVWIGIDSSGEKYATNAYRYYIWKQRMGIKYPIVLDIDGKVGKKYGAHVTPHMVVINKGKVVYQGAIDDDVFGDKPIDKRKNYILLALNSLTQTGKLPKKFKQFREAEGCGIKY